MHGINFKDLPTPDRGGENVTEQDSIGAGIPCRLDACGEKKNELRPSWRGLVISVLAAAILSMAATLLLGGAGNLTGGAAPGRCGGAVCVLPGGDAASGMRAPRSGSDGGFPAAGVSRSTGRPGPAAAIPAAADVSTGERSAR